MISNYPSEPTGECWGSGGAAMQDSSRPDMSEEAIGILQLKQTSNDMKT